MESGPEAAAILRRVGGPHINNIDYLSLGKLPMQKIAETTKRGKLRNAREGKSVEGSSPTLETRTRWPGVASLKG